MEKTTRLLLVSEDRAREKELRKFLENFDSRNYELEEITGQGLMDCPGADHHPNAVILDIAGLHARSMDSMVILGKCLPDVPTIILTNAETLNQTAELMAAGAANYFSLQQVTPKLFEWMINDAIEKKQVAHTLTHIKMLNESILQSASEGIVTQDEKGNFTFVNPAAAYLWGYTPEEMIGRPWQDFFPPDYQNIIETADKQRKMGESSQYEVHLLCKDRTQRQVLVNGSPQFQDGLWVGSIAVFSDISALKSAEDKVRLSAANFAALYEIAIDLAKQQDLPALLNFIVDQATRLLGTPYGALYSFDTQRRDLVLVADKGLNLSHDMRLNIREGMAGIVAESRQPMAVYDYQVWQGQTDKYEGFPFSSMLEVPLMYQGELVGVLAVSERVPKFRHFSDEETHLLSLFAAQAAGALRNAELFEQARRRLSELEAIDQISKVLRSVDSLEDMLPILLDQTLAILGCDTGDVVLYDSKDDYLKSQVARGWLRDLQWLQLRPGEGISGHVFLTGEPYIAREFPVDPQTYEDVRTIIPSGYGGACVAIRAGEEKIGILFVAVALPREITAENLSLLRLLAEIAGNAIHRTRLHLELQSRARELDQSNKELQRLYHTTGSLLSGITLDTTVLGNMIVNAVLQEFGQSNCSVILVNPDSVDLRPLAAGGQFAEDAVHGTISLEGNGLIARAIRTGQIVNAPDVNLDEDYLACWPECRSELVIPLMIGDQVIGAIDVQNSKCCAFNDDDIRIMKAFADRAALLLQSSQLYSQTERRLQFLSALRSIELAISNSLDIRVTLSILLDHAVTQLGTDAAQIFLLNKNNRRLEFAAGRGFRSGREQRVRISLGSGIAGQLAMKNHSEILPNVAGREAEFNRSWLFADEAFVAYFGIPLVAKGEVKGILEIFNRSELVPDAEWLDFLQAMAGNAAIAIDSAQLFEDLQRSNLELGMTFDATIEAWANSLELNHLEDTGHNQRVTDLTLQLAVKMGVDEKELVNIRRGALLHDVGKIVVPVEILKKTEELTEHDWLIIREHPGKSHQLLSSISYLRSAIEIPFCHHERWDGKGYPRGLKGEEIPLPARMFSVVEVWDVLLHDRPYAKAWKVKEVMRHLLDQAGKQFDPWVVESFFQLVDDLEV